MKNFWSVLCAIIAFFSVLIGALVIIDKIKNKNRIKGEYLECDDVDNLADVEE